VGLYQGLVATAYGRDADLTHSPPPPEASPPAAAAPSGRSPAHDPWAMRLARLVASLPLVCPNGGWLSPDGRVVRAMPPAPPTDDLYSRWERDDEQRERSEERRRGPTAEGAKRSDAGA
jgi:hypothetical protein